ncbi:DinB family protein [Ruegeria lacuscaerulensis]|uniref:DinB family protein n=1 Tax=Ruegeria lacuscaerulensis TaxID=55218 RepID=UPI00147E3633|nr:DinB family protein [Ruegeria lacuscaerulensis]
MITAAYAQEMARYNRWQNSQLKKFFSALTTEELNRERGAFFGSILGTANHLLWGDWIWMSRFDGGEGPDGGIPESTAICADVDEWVVLRDVVDTRIEGWVASLKDEALSGPFTWFSAAKQADVTKPYAQCVMHFFNHQTHHRGQIHKMLTETGSAAPVSDLVFLPQEG